jgi:8-oxo-dGTP diphosphatase
VDKKKYVLIHAYDVKHPERVLLVEKNRPAWQRGCLNLLGGKIEEGESELDCAIRELKEESGLTIKSTRRRQLDGHPDVKLMGAIVSEASMVYCVSLPVDSTVKLKPRKGETELASWHEWDVVKSDPRLMPNLRCVIPMIKAGVTGWFVSGGAIAEAVYEANVRFLLDAPVPHKPED